MILPQVQQINMTKVTCSLVDHEGNSIKTLCLNPQCKESSTLCQKCLINNHLSCRSQVLELKEVPKSFRELQQLQLTIVTLQENINQQFKKLLSGIEAMLLPLAKYEDKPNFTNLNEIGFLLRKLPKQNILKIIDETKIEIRNLLDNHYCNQEKIQENLQQNDVVCYKKGRTLLLDGKQEESIKWFQEAIQINPNHQAAISILKNIQLNRSLLS